MKNANFKMGLLPVKNDTRTLCLENYYQFQDPPEERVWSDKVSKYGMMLNDRLNNCAIAGPGHAVQTQTANAKTEVIIPDNIILKEYAILSGYNPKTGKNNNGLYMLDVLNYWRKYGIGGHKIGAYMAVNPRNSRLVKIAINEFGGCLNGMSLPVSAQNKNRWDIDASFNGDGMPGSWGGHCTYTSDFLKTGDYIHITWGEKMPVSEHFDMVYCQEKYVVLSEDFINDKRISPSNFAWEKMIEDLNHITA